MNRKTISHPPTKGQSSLWTTPVGTRDLSKRLIVDRAVTAADLKQAVEGVKERAAVFSGRVSEETLTLNLD